jgi:glycosyltransferase involved in cell wall biosynthesis|tara:strand:- start:847 stop:2139 length:1293 start_codon:yes stop_codon:yes gene_type:complete
MENIKKFCVVSCPISTRSGYGARSRDFVRALIEARPEWDVQILSQRWGNTPMDALVPGEDDDLLSRIIIKKEDRKPNVWIQITVPNEFNPVGDYNIGVTAGVETSMMPPECIEGMNRMDKVLVSANFAKSITENSIYDKKDQKTNQLLGQLKMEKPIEVLFEGIDLNVYNNKAKSEPRIDEMMKDVKESFCFLFVGHWLKGDFQQDRKNIGGMIKVFLEAFKNKKNQPALFLKTSRGSGALTDRVYTKKLIEMIKDTVDTTRLPNIYLLNSDLTDREVNALYNHPKVKAHVSFTRGEGFGRPLLEATISGKPMVVSGWSGQTDFLNADMVNLIGGELQNVHPSAADDKFLLKESQWFQINYSEAGGVMKDMFDNYKKYLEKSRKHRQHTKDNFTWEKMKDLLSDYLKEADEAEVSPQQVGLSLPKLKKIK